MYLRAQRDEKITSVASSNPQTIIFLFFFFTTINHFGLASGFVERDPAVIYLQFLSFLHHVSLANVHECTAVFFTFPSTPFLTQWNAWRVKLQRQRIAVFCVCFTFFSFFHWLAVK